MNRITAAAIIGLLGLLAFSPPAQATTYTFETFECPEANPGTTVATGINDSEGVSGYYIGADDSYHGFVRSTGGDCTEIDGPNGEPAQALGINNNGDVVGVCFPMVGSMTGTGFMRSAADGSYTTFNISAFDQDDYALGINDTDQIAGTIADSSGVHGFVRSAEGVVTTFDYPSAPQTCAMGINNYGEVTGIFYDAYTNQWGYVRSADGVSFSKFQSPVPLTWAYGLNDGGQVVGSMNGDGFVRSADGLEFSTVQYPKAEVGTFALGINYTGQVVGYAATSDSPYYTVGFIATPVSTAPVIDKPASSVITTTTATLGATIESNGGYPITAAGIAYGNSQNPTSSGKKVTTTVKKGAFKVKVTGLTSNTLYHFRGYATNSSPATAYTADSTFTTLATAPVANAATGISAAGFTANWTASPGSSAITNYLLDVATNSGFTSFVSGYENITVSGTSAQVTGLVSGKTYYYRIRAVNAGGASASSKSEKVVLPGIALTFPTSGKTLKTSGKCVIKWTYTGIPGSVEIDLLEGGNKISTIISSTSAGSNGTGSYSWTIPSETPGSDYQVQVSSTTISSCTATSKDFTISGSGH